jgi:protein involved in polysaccharide export with SLBB domain
MFLRVIRRISSLINLLLPIAFLCIVAWCLKEYFIEPSPADVAANSKELGNRNSKDLSAAKSDNATILNVGANDRRLISSGDTLELAFYERLIEEEDKWSAQSYSRRPPASFQLRPELSGSYPVQESGHVFIPLLGQFAVAGETVGKFESDARKAFESSIGRLAFLSVTIVHRPVFVVGLVKKPGSYPFTTGMTVFHILALAGGLEQQNVDLGQVLLAVHEAEASEKSGDRLKRLWAKLSVLEAEDSNTKPIASTEMLKICPASEADQFIESEHSLRQLSVQSNKAQRDALDDVATHAREQLEIYQRRKEQVETSIAIRSERLDNLNSIADKIGRPIRAQAEADLSDVKARLQEAMATVEEAKVKLAQAKKDQVAFQNQMAIDREQQIADLKSQIADATSTRTASARALGAMKDTLAGAIAFEDGTSLFKVTRTTDSGTQTFSASGTEALQPGDLVQVSATATSSQPPM